MGINNSINEANDIQIFTNVGYDTWIKPTGAKFVYVVCVGAGGGGGSGGSQQSSTQKAGGGGGGGGATTFKMFTASDLPNTVTILVGSGGTGGEVLS